MQVQLVNFVFRLSTHNLQPSKGLRVLDFAVDDSIYSPRGRRSKFNRKLHFRERTALLGAIQPDPNGSLLRRRLAARSHGLFREPRRVQDETRLPVDCFDDCALFVFHKSYLLVRGLAEEFRF